MLGIVSLLEGELEEAERRFIGAARQNPDSIEARWFGGQVAWLRGDRARAREWLKEAHALARGGARADRSASGEGDTRLGAALIAAEGVPLAEPLERWKTLARRLGEAETEYGGKDSPRRRYLEKTSPSPFGRAPLAAPFPEEKKPR